MSFAVIRRCVCTVTIALGILYAGSASAGDCHPDIGASTSQHIIGYGSLMETNSKRSTEPDSGINLPARMTGLQRAWNTNGVYPTTLLGAQPSKSAQMVAALYQDFLKDGKLCADAREIDYCRAAVPPASIEMLVTSPSQNWIYVNKPGTLAAPDAQNSIVQSHADIFIKGCLRFQARVADESIDFVEECVRKIGDWPKLGSTTVPCHVGPTFTSLELGGSTKT